MNQLTIEGTYANTTNLQGAELQKEVSNASKQEKAILRWMQRHPGRSWAPHELLEWFPQWPITSVRRALTYMTEKQILVKSEHPDTIGAHGKRVHSWRIAK